VQSFLVAMLSNPKVKENLLKDQIPLHSHVKISPRSEVQVIRFEP